MNWADYFYYDESSPTCLRWAVTKGPRAKEGSTAGYVHKGEQGRLTCRVNLDGSNFLVHRVIWELCVGLIPDGLEIDHENGNPLCNVLSNLRVVDGNTNMKNKGRYRNNASGITGVSRTSNSKGVVSWIAQWNGADGKRKGRMFSVRKYGEETAKRLAIVARDEALLTLEGYTKRHGT